MMTERINIQWKSSWKSSK